MICKSCKREIEDNSIFCNWCGGKQIRAKKKKAEIRIPKPKLLPSGNWFIELRKENLCNTFETEAECISWAIAVRRGFIKAAKKKSGITVGDAIDLYIANNSNVLSPSTIKAYKSVRAHRFQSVMDLDVNGSINWMAVVNAESGLVSPKTVCNSWSVLSSSLKAQGIVLPDVKLPKVPKAERPWLDYEQIQKFLKLIYDTPFEIGALLALNSLRRSELFAVDPSSVNLKAETITVSGSMVYNSDGVFIKKLTNKNASSQRVVPIIIPRLLELLKSSDNIIVSGSPSMLYHQINNLCKKNGLPEVGIHGLRHSFASLAYHLKWSEASTMAIGGWSDSKVVHEIYTHLAQQDKNADVLKMRDFYSNSANLRT